jgi:protein-S-isoprenylcysteine O-methyltransferase Ste14
MAVALFWSAGRIDWWAAWATLAVMAGWIIATTVIIFRHNPDLLAERTDYREGNKPWDAAVVSLIGLAQLVRYIVAGLDQRYGWTGGFPVAAQLVALTLCAFGYALFVWATAANPFFSRLYRIQAERGHVVVAGGPYRAVRHPAYSGATLYELAVPFLLASWWAIPFSIVSAGLLVLRTALEDRALHAELPGYTEYAAHTRYRLLPGLW